jgi:hypothetical protein
LRIVYSSIVKFMEVIMTRFSRKLLFGASHVGLIGLIAICASYSPVLSSEGVNGVSSVGVGTYSSKELLQSSSSIPK